MRALAHSSSPSSLGRRNLYSAPIERRKEPDLAEKYGEVGERQLELLRVVADLASNDPAAVAQMY